MLKVYSNYENKMFYLKLKSILNKIKKISYIVKYVHTINVYTVVKQKINIIKMAAQGRNSSESW